MQIFPSSIIEYSIENHFYKQKIKSDIIYIIVLLSSILIIISMFIVNVEISTQTRGIVISKEKNNKLLSCVFGHISKNILKENIKVNKGDTLIWINSKSIDSKLNINRNILRLTYNYLIDLKQLVKNKNNDFITSKFKSEYSKYKIDLEEQRIKIKYFENEFNIAKSLIINKAISLSEFEETKNRYSLSISKLKQIKATYINKWEDSINSYKMKISELESNINQLKNEKKKYNIIAPISGTIMNYNSLSENSTINPNMNIAEISSEKSLIIQCYISPREIGLIKKGMKVKFQYDAYNYNEWGLGDGIITDISNDAIHIKDNPVYLIKCKMNQKVLKLDNGYTGKIKKGMTLTARIHITERSIFHLIYDKLDDWLNPKNI